MFGKAVFEVTEVKGVCMVKEQDFEAEKIKMNAKKSNIQLWYNALFNCKITQLTFSDFWVAIVNFDPFGYIT